MKFIAKLFNNNVQKNIIYTLTLIIICYGFIGAASVFASPIEGTKLKAIVNGSQVSPPVNTTASGNASLIYKSDTFEFPNLLFYNISVSNIEEVTEVHLHQGPLGLNGTISNNLPIFPNYEETGILSNGNISKNDSFQYELGGKGEYVIDVLMNYLSSGQMYIDIHTKKYPDGEIRGQIYPH